MKTAHRVALIYGVCLLGAAGISFYRQRRGKELLVDTLIHGLVVGTAFNVVGFLVLSNGEKIPVLGKENNYASLTEAADDLDLPDDLEVVDVELAEEAVENTGEEYRDVDEEERAVNEEEVIEQQTSARDNFSIFKKSKANGMGKTPPKAVELLSKLNTKTLYADMKHNGVKVAEVPENASMILQDED
jgi:hypothetical protein